MFAQPFIDFGDLGLIKSVGKRFKPSLLIVFENVFSLEKNKERKENPNIGMFGYNF